MEKTLLITGAVLALSSSLTVNATENDRSQYPPDWWRQSVNVIGSYHTRFGPQVCNDIYLEHETFAKEDWLDLYGYADTPVFFGGNSDVKGIWSYGSPLFMEIKPRLSIDKLTNTDLSLGPFKEWCFASNYIYNMDHNKDNRQSTWYMGLGTDIDIGLLMNLSIDIYTKYQWQNYDIANENEWDGYRFKIRYFMPITDLWGGQLSYIGFTNSSWGSDLGDDSGNTIDGTKTRTNSSVAFSHIPALNYDHQHYSVVARYWCDGGQWNDDAELNFGNGNFDVHSTGWGGCLVVGYNS